jgi:hypothetical protein
MFNYFDSISIKNAGLLLEIRRIKLMALVCTHIACKYQEIYYPYVAQFLKNEFSFEDYIFIEENLLKDLDFKIQVPFDLNYVCIIQKYLELNIKFVEFIFQMFKLGLATNTLRKYDVKSILLGILTQVFEKKNSAEMKKKLLVLESVFGLNNIDYVRVAKDFIYDVNGFYPLVRIEKYNGLIEYLEVEQSN